MYEFLARDVEYVIRVEEILWGCGLLAITLVIHGVGVFHVARVSASLSGPAGPRMAGLGAALFVVAILGIVVLQLAEVLLWALFFAWKGAQPNASSAFYYALVNYTTLGAGYLPIRWRLLEGMLGMAGLLCFAFSTSALLALAQRLVRMPFAERRGEAGDSSR